MKKNNHIFKNPIFWAILICFLYWSYLFFTARADIACDSILYENMGRLLLENRWIEYFKDGPPREPFYPLMISIAMRLGRLFSISYYPIMTIIQLIFLFLSQIMVLHILRLLKIRDLIISLTVLYLGISPAIVNSSLSIFSEIAAYPLILAMILILYYSWLSLDGSKVHIIVLAIISGILFCFTTLTKGIFEFIIPAFVMLLVPLYLYTRKQKIMVGALIFLMVSSAIYYLPLNAYKMTNKIFNNHFAVTNRGDFQLFAAAVRRTEPMTTEQLLMALASIPGEGVCQSIFGKEKCSYWSVEKIDEIGSDKVQDLVSKGLRPEDASKLIVKLAIKKGLQNPGQYTLFWLMESVKMFFWESTQIGFVAYPIVLDKIFKCTLFKNGIRLSMSVLTLIAFLYTVVFLCIKQKTILKAGGIHQGDAAILLTLNILLISLFIGAYSLFPTVPRFALPIAPLYLIIIAFFFQQVLFEKK